MIASVLKNQLRRRFADRVRFDEPMSRHTSFKVGGPADAWIEAADENDLAFLMPLLHGNGLPFMVVGGGTNLLVKDGGFRGVVIAMTAILTEIAAIDAETVCAMAGAKLNALCRYAILIGLSGLNFAMGIPGTVGGAIRMNAGTATGSIGGVLDSIRVMGPDGEIRRLAAPLLQFGYRRMTMSAAAHIDLNDCAIIDAYFTLAPGDPEILAAEADGLLKKRKSTQPVHLAGAGCFFKNPEAGEPAGKLIDLAGLKGLRVGMAEVSPMHGNYIVNQGGASAADILNLMEIVRQTVFEKFNIWLEPEVKIVGI